VKNKIDKLIQDIPSCMLCDQFQMMKKLQILRKSPQRAKLSTLDIKSLDQLETAITRSSKKVLERRALLPSPVYAENLPISAHKDELIDLINRHQVLVVCGETGSGKTTQLPKICLSMGRGVKGMIGHTQPRRIAAKSVASRLAAELDIELGTGVGYKMRFTDNVSSTSFVKLMTDGILLAEIRRDRFLQQYDTLIIDEAHERSINIDFLLGYLKWLLPKRPDLKLLITSATIDTKSFSSYFNDAPVIEIAGRSFPVEVVYRAALDEDENATATLPEQVVAAIDEVASSLSGDVLVFLPGERSIRECAELLRKHHPAQTEILPLYSRLSMNQQQKIFSPHRGMKIILATNVAETSLTVPGVHCVIDSGLARMSVYSPRSKIQRLPVLPISQASAWQRAGRCGRVAPGICIRLYSQEDFENRPEYTDPEIVRSNLAAVILQMASLGLAKIEDFSFIKAPDQRMINSGYKLLEELGAIDSERKLTNVGKQLSRYPVDPRVARIIIEAGKENCLNEVLVIAALLSTRDPRMVDRENKNQQHHKKYVDERSDFITILNLWTSVAEQYRHLSANKFKKYCRDEKLSYFRFREWSEVYKQLRGQVLESGLRLNSVVASYEAIHRALLVGFTSNVATRSEDKSYIGPRNNKFTVFPDSTLVKSAAKWIFSGEVFETSRLFMRQVAHMESQWIETVAPHLVKYQYDSPAWDVKRAQVVANRSASFYGLLINSRVKIHYGKIDPQQSREIFLREALVEGRFDIENEFFVSNQKLIATLREKEDKLRQRDVLVNDQCLYDFYHSQIPEAIVDGRSFKSWYKKQKNNKLLVLTEKDCSLAESNINKDDLFPNELLVNGVCLPLKYHFSPGDKHDGVSVVIPVSLIHQLESEYFDWLVPGLIKEKVIALIKSLPKTLRKRCVPANNFADAFLQSVKFAEGALLSRLATELSRISGAEIIPASFRQELILDHLKMNFMVIDNAGVVQKQGKNFKHLMSESILLAKKNFADISFSEFETKNINEPNFEFLLKTVEIVKGGVRFRGFSSLHYTGEQVDQVVLDSKESAVKSSCESLCRLYINSNRKKITYLEKSLPDIDKIMLLYSTIGDCRLIKEEIIVRVIETLLVSPSIPLTSEQYLQRLAVVNEQLITECNAFCVLLLQVLEREQKIRKKLRCLTAPYYLLACKDIQQQLNELIYEGFFKVLDLSWFKHFPRFLDAIILRLDKLESKPEKDQHQSRELAPLINKFREKLKSQREDNLPLIGKEPDKDDKSKTLEQLRWMLEELRVSLFAQELKTSNPVSIKRVSKYL